MARWQAEPDKRNYRWRDESIDRPGEKRRVEVVDRLTGKVSKQSAEYRGSHEEQDKASCAECEHYLIPGNPTSSCRRVAGVVEARDVCDLFCPRMAEHGDNEEV